MATATSFDAIPRELLRYLVAASTTFQSTVPADNITEARQRIYIPADDGEEPASINAVISPGPSRSSTKIGIGTWVQAGNLYLTFQFIMPRQHEDEESQETTFLNLMGAIRSEMMAQAGHGDAFGDYAHLNMTEMTLTEYGHCMIGERDIPEDDTGEDLQFVGHPAELWVAEYLVEWQS